MKEDIWTLAENAARHLMEGTNITKAWHPESYAQGYRDGIAYATKQLDLLIAEQKKGGEPMTPVIEHNIPIPQIKRGNKNEFLRHLAVGDSFLVESRRAAVKFYQLSGREGFKVCLRQLPDGTCRVWRVS